MQIKQEISIQRMVKHPNVVSIIEVRRKDSLLLFVFCLEEKLYMWMHWCRSWLRRKRYTW